MRAKYCKSKERISRGGQWPPAFYVDYQRKWAADGRPFLLWNFPDYPTALTFSAVIFCQGMSMAASPAKVFVSQAS